MSGKEGENALVPAHSGKGVDGLLDTRLCLLALKESLELFLQRVTRVSVSEFQFGRKGMELRSYLCGVVKAVGHGGT